MAVAAQPASLGWAGPFLGFLAEGMSVSAACRAAGVSRSRAYELRDVDEVFAGGWADARVRQEPAPAPVQRAASAEPQVERSVRARGRQSPYYFHPRLGEVARPNALHGRVVTGGRVSRIRPGEPFDLSCPDCGFEVPEDRLEDHVAGVDSECTICPRQNLSAIRGLMDPAGDYGWPA